MPLFFREFGIDIGTLNLTVAEGSQILMQEPNVAAILVEEQKIVEWGGPAKEMYGKVPETIEVIRPMRNGVIAEYEVTEQLMSFIIKKVAGPMNVLFKPTGIFTIPYGVTSVESRAVHEVAIESGCGEIHIIHQPLAAAIGVDLPIATPSGNMIISLGGGTHQVAVLAMNSIVTAETSRTGGLALDDAIIAYIRKKYGVVIGQPTAESLKINIGAAVPQHDQKVMEVQGQHQVSNLPETVQLNTDEIIEAIQEPMNILINTAKRVLEQTPPELISDIIDRGVAICGGGALLTGIDRFITKSLGIPAYVVDNPQTCTVLGAVKALSMRGELKRSLISP